MVKELTSRYADVSETANRLVNTSRFHLTKGFIQHGKISVYAHCFSVAVMSIRIANFLDIEIDRKALIRGALLHDYFLYDWHDTDNDAHRWHGFTHPSTALRNAQEDFDLTTRECDIIEHHMFPLVPFPPKCREAWIVCLADKICALKETLFCR